MEPRCKQGAGGSKGHPTGRKDEKGARALGRERADSVLRAGPALPGPAAFSDLRREGPLLAGKRSSGQGATSGSRVGRSWNKAGRLRGWGNRTKQRAWSKRVSEKGHEGSETGGSFEKAAAGQSDCFVRVCWPATQGRLMCEKRSLCVSVCVSVTIRVTCECMAVCEATCGVCVCVCERDI